MGLGAVLAPRSAPQFLRILQGSYKISYNSGTQAKKFLICDTLRVYSLPDISVVNPVE